MRPSKTIESTSVRRLSIHTFILILSLSLFPAIGNAKTTQQNPQVESAVMNLMKRFSIPGAAVLIYRDGQLEQYTFGYSDFSKKTPVTEQTLFELGSITKTFTGLLLAQQVRSGKIQFNDGWAKFQSPDKTYSSSTDSISLLELATYTASLPKDVKGLPYNAANTTQYQTNLARFLKNWNAAYPPGTHMLYSNLSFSLLGMALAEQQDKTLTQLMQLNIFRPLKMTGATLSIAKGDENYTRYAQGYDAEGKPARTAAGGLLSSSWALKASLRDMAEYLKAAVGDPRTPASLLASMQLAQTGFFEMPTTKNATQIGLGWFIIPFNNLSKNDFNSPAGRKAEPRPVRAIAEPRFNGGNLIDKTGSTNGFRAYIGVIPNQRIGIVILTNKFIYHGGAVRDLGRALLINMSPSGVHLKG